MTESKNNIRRATVRVLGAALLLSGFSALGFVGCNSGHVGDPCTPEDEYRQNFAGFKLTEENIESRSFQCQTRICLVNHFQGRVSCPEGQPAPTTCQPSNGNAECAGEPGTTCTPAGAIVNNCDPTPCSEKGANPNDCNKSDGSNETCGGNVCDAEGRFCHCSSAQCPENYYCDSEARQCLTAVCSKPRNELAEGEQRCYVPGTEEPIAVPVCGQCAAASKRDAENAVYCSCRCDVADDTPPDPADDNFNFCSCPDGFVCEEIRKFIGISDRQLSGKYCIKQNTKYVDENACGTVQGWWDEKQCKGQPAKGQTSG